MDADFAQKIHDAVLETLKRQKDMQQEQTLFGKQIINPQTFTIRSPLSTLGVDVSTMTPQARRQYFEVRGQDKRHYTTGLIQLTTTFSDPPMITFGQASKAPGDDAAPGIADNTIPFIVQPYLSSWHHTGGEVDGFYLGLYALTAPIPGVSQHFIYWSVTGKASRYKGRAQEDQWAASYDYKALAHLGAGGT